MKKRECIIIAILTLVITFMDISGLPSVALLNMKIADVDPIFISLMVNFILIGIIAYIVLRLFCPNWKLGFTSNGFTTGLKKYSLAGIIAAALSSITFLVGLYPFDYEPTAWRIIIEGVFYYAGVAVIEELYVRGLFLNLVEKMAHKKENKTVIAIIVSSLVFGIGHVPGTLGMGIGVIVFKLISTVGMGLYFGTIYKKTNNLWLPIVLHTLIDISALPYCFTTFSGYKTVSLIFLIPVYIGLGCYSLWLMQKKTKTEKCEAVGDAVPIHARGKGSRRRGS